MPISNLQKPQHNTYKMNDTNGDTTTNGSGIRSPMSVVSPINSPIQRLDLPKNKKALNSQRTIDEMRNHIAKLKTDLDGEKNKYKQLYRDKVAEIKQTRVACEQEKEYVLSQCQVKLEQERHVELNKLREQLQKEKDAEVRQVLKYKDDEIKQCKALMSSEKEDAIKTAMEMQKKALTEQREAILTSPTGATRPSSGSNSALIVRLQREMKQLKDAKKDLEEQLKTRTTADSEKAGELRKIKKEHRDEMTKLVKEYKQEGFKDMQLLKKTDDIGRLDGRRSVGKGDSDCESIRSSRNRTESTRSNTPISPRGSITNSIDGDDETKKVSEDRERERHTTKKLTELTSQVTRLEKRVNVLKAENQTLKNKTEDHKPAEEKIKKLKKRNAELAAIARRLEEKAKQLQSDSKKPLDRASPSDPESIKKAFARQRAKDLAEHAKSALSKDKDIEALRNRCQQLADQLANGNNNTSLQNPEIYTDQQELESIIKQAAKERLRLEHQINTIPLKHQNEAQQLRALEETNIALQAEIHKLSTALQHTEKLEIEVTQRKIECETLYKEIDEARTQCSRLENELQDVIVRNTQLTVHNSDLQQRLLELDHVSEECEILRTNLAHVEGEWQAAKDQVSSLHVKVSSLEAIIQRLEEVAENHVHLEDEHRKVCEALRAREDEVRMLSQAREEAEREHDEALEGLQAKLRELERKYELQAIKHEELTLEMTQLRHEAERAKQRPPTHTIHIQTETGTSSPSPSLQPHQPPPSSSSPAPSGPHRILPETSLSIDNNNYQPSNQENPTPTVPSSVVSTKSQAPTIPSSLAEELELSDIGNKIKALALDSSSGSEGDISEPEGEEEDDEERENDEQELKNIKNIIENNNYSGKDLADGDGHVSPGPPLRQLMSPIQPGLKMSTDGEVMRAVSPKKSAFQVYVAKYSYDPDQFSPNENPEAELVLNAGDYVFVYGEMDEDGFFEAELMDGRRGLVPSNFVEAVPEEDLEDFHAALAGGGGTQDDSSHSGSLQHELEFNSSDESERMAELSEFLDQDAPIEEVQKVKQKSLDVLSDLEDIEECEEETDRTGSLSALDAEVYKGIPAPARLQLDRQLTNSVLISWSPPTSTRPNEVEAYHVLVDGQLRTSVKGTERTKALLESVSSTQTHRISVRTVTARGNSLDSECTILVGKDADLAVTDVKMSHVTATSGTLTWMPGDTNLEHIIAVNGIDTRTARPGVSRVQLTGLSPSCRQRVSVRPKFPNHPFSNTLHMARSIEFITPAAGIPDAPLDVQVESGPQKGSLLITWLPVTITTAGTSNGAKVLGYAVYADGACIKELMSPTGDHIVLTNSVLERISKPQGLTIRTLADGKQSVDSNAAPLLPHIWEELTGSEPPQDIIEISTECNEPGSVELAIVAIPPETLDSTSELSDIAEEEEVEAETEKETETSKHQQSNGEDAKLASPPLRESTPRNNADGTDEIVQAAPGSTQGPPAPYNRSQEAMPMEPGPDGPMRAWSPQGQHAHGQSPNSHAQQSRQQQGRMKHPGSEPDGMESGFTPVQDVPADIDRGLPNRTPPRGAESPPKSPAHRSRDPSMNVPHIEITKDSSGSISTSGAENYSDEDGESVLSSTSGISSKPSPVSPDRHFCDIDGRQPRMSPNHPSLQHGKNGPFMGRDSGPGPKSPGPQRSPGPIPAPNPTHLGKQPHGDKSPSLHRQTIAERRNRQDKRPLPSNREKRRDYFDEHDQYEQGINNSRSPPYISGGAGDDFSGLENNNDMGPRKILDDIPDSDLIDYEDEGEGESLVDDIDMEYEDQRIRVFIALFDYDPTTMSPNPDALDEELPFKEGQIIRVYGDKDPDGFYLGESNGRQGLVPGNMVSEVQVDDPNVAAQLLNQSGGGPSPHPSSGYDERSQGHRRFNGTSHKPGDRDRVGKPHSPRNGGTHYIPDGPVRRMVALYDYDPQELSPNVDVELELTIRTGDVIHVYGEMDDDGFFYGEFNGKFGLVPSNFLQEAPLTYDEYGRQSSPRTPRPSVELGSEHNASDRHRPDRDYRDDRGSRRRSSPHRRGSPHGHGGHPPPPRRTSPHSRGGSRGGGEPDIIDMDMPSRDHIDGRNYHDGREHSRDRDLSRDRDRDLSHERDRDRSHDRDRERSRDRDHSYDRDRDRGPSFRDRDRDHDRERDHDHEKDHSGSRRGSHHSEDKDQPPGQPQDVRRGGRPVDRRSRRDHPDPKRHDRSPAAQRDHSREMERIDSQRSNEGDKEKTSSRPSTASSKATAADIKSIATLSSGPVVEPGKISLSSILTPSTTTTTKPKPGPLIKEDTLMEDSVIEPEIDPEQDPLSPQRMITFDDNSSSKKKKGFFSKGKNIFKKLSR